MGLRSNLQDILDLQGLTGNFATAAQGLREQAAQQQLQETLPENLRLQNFGAIAPQAFAAGNQQLGNALIEQQLKSTAVKPGQNKLSRDLIKQGLPKELQSDENLISSIDSAGDRKTQDFLINRISSNKNAEISHGIAAGGLEERKGAKVEELRNAALAGIDKQVKDFNAQADDLKAATDALDQGGTIGESGALVFIAKNIQGQSGVLTDKDIDREIRGSIYKTRAQLANYLSGKSEGELTPEARELVNKVINIAKAKVETARDRNLQLAISHGSFDNPRLLQNGQPDPAFIKRAEEAGLTYDRKTKKYIKKEGEPATVHRSTQSTDGSQGSGDVVALVTSANALPPGPIGDKVKSTIKTVTDAWAAKKLPLPQAVYDDLVRRITAAGGAPLGQ